MIRSFLRRAFLFTIALAAGVGMLWWGHRVEIFRDAEEAIFKTIAAEIVTQPFVISGSHEPGKAWVVRPILSTKTPPADPQFLAITDDPEQVFESNPPSPADYSVILSQLQRLGHREVAISLPLAWDEPDPIALAALEHLLGKFETAIVASPLTRSISPRPMPPAFARASIPVASTIGNVRLLPTVNRTSYDSILLDDATTLAGFSLLESEDPPEFSNDSEIAVPLLARWEDRVVFSFPLLVAMARAGVTPDKIQIHLGAHLILGDSGAMIPIDAHGRFHFLPTETPTQDPATPAEALIAALLSEKEDSTAAALYPIHPPIILRDDRSAIPKPEREFSQTLDDLILALEANPKTGKAVVFYPPAIWIYISLLAGFAVLVAWFSNLTPFSRALAVLLTGSLVFMLLLALAEHFHLRIPFLPIAVILLVSLAVLCKSRPNLPTAPHDHAKPPAAYS